MLVESGLALALEGESRVFPRCGGGVWTPAVCLGQVLVDRLAKTGTTFDVKLLPKKGGQI